MAWNSAMIFAEGAALLGECGCGFERALRHPDACAAMPMRPPSSALERDLQSLPFFAETIFGGHFAIVEHDFDRRRRVLAHFFFVAADAKSLEAGLDEKRGDVPLRTGVGIGLSRKP